MEKLICNASWGKTKTSRLARVVTLALVGAAGTTLSAHARQIVIPTLPMSPFADTEVSTNVVIHESRTDMRDVKIRLQLDGTPTNNLEIAFGCDENTNGVLDVSEIETVYGWRAGRYFIENVRAWERMEAEAAPGALCGVIDVHVAIGRDFRPSRFSATCGGAPAFGSLSSAPPAWLFRSDWDMMRVARRGTCQPAEWVRCDIGYTRGAIIVR